MSLPLFIHTSALSPTGTFLFTANILKIPVFKQIGKQANKHTSLDATSLSHCCPAVLSLLQPSWWEEWRVPQWEPSALPVLLFRFPHLPFAMMFTQLASAHIPPPRKTLVHQHPSLPKSNKLLNSLPSCPLAAQGTDDACLFTGTTSYFRFCDDTLPWFSFYHPSIPFQSLEDSLIQRLNERSVGGMTLTLVIFLG